MIAVSACSAFSRFILDLYSWHMVMNHAQQAMQDISKELFWQGYKIWNSRKRLMSKFWQDIAPTEWSPHQQTQRKKTNVHDKYAAEKCINSFHFLKKCVTLSHMKPTPCPCSRLHVKQY